METDIRIQSDAEAGAPVVLGVPLASDVEDASDLSIRHRDGRLSPAQATPLTPPTSCGTRWWELAFLCPGPGDASLVRTPPAAPACAVPLANESDGGIVLDNQRIRVAISPTVSEPPVAVEWGSASGTLHPEIVTEEFGMCAERPGAERRIRVLRNGPSRAQVEIAGTLAGFEGFLDYRCTVEVWRDTAALRVDWMVTHRMPNMAGVTVRSASLRGQWDVGDHPERVFRQNSYSALGKARDVRNSDGVQLVADENGALVHVADPAMLRDAADYPHYCVPPAVDTGHWLQMHGRRGRVNLSLVDFAESRPNMLASSANELSYHMVPPGSSFPWPQGRRKEQTVLLSFGASDDGLSAGALAELSSAVFAHGRAFPTPETLRRHGCFDMDRVVSFTPSNHLRMNAHMDELCKLASVSSKWDVGDTPDWHYTRGYGTSPNQYMPLSGAEDFPPRFGAGSTPYVFPDVRKFFMEPVWSNNEYDAIHTLATEVMRTARDNHFAMLRWAARHNIEVDFVAYSDDAWHHRASPFHSHFHNHKGAITSHFWTQGLLQYYCLTGDRDALEVALALGDKIVEFNSSDEVREWKFDREIGWALLALTCLVEAGYTRYADEAGRVADFLRSYDRTAFHGAVKLSAGKAGRSLERQMVDCGFGYASMVEALDRYEKLADDDDLGPWLETLLYDLKTAFWEKLADGERVNARTMNGLVMTIGYERTGDADFLDAAEATLEPYLDCAFPMAAGAEAGQIKPCAMAYRGLHRLLGALERAGRLETYDYPALQERNALRRQSYEVSGVAPRAAGPTPR